MIFGSGMVRGEPTPAVPVDLASVVCEPCGSVGVKPTRFRDVLGLGVDLVECLACGARFYSRPWCDLWHANDVHDAWMGMERWASRGDYFAPDESQVGRIRAGLRRMYRDLIAQLGTVAGLPFTAVYEVGAGFGQCMAAARDVGLRVNGCEVNRRAVSLAMELWDIEVEHAAFADATLPPGPVDGIVMLDVIEHTDTPRADLLRAHDMLRPSGGLLLKTFYDECHDAIDVLPGSWDDPGRGYFDPVGHRHHFTEPTLLGLLARTGFAAASAMKVAAHGQITVYATRGA